MPRYEVRTPRPTLDGSNDRTYFLDCQGVDDACGSPHADEREWARHSTFREIPNAWCVVDGVGCAEGVRWCGRWRFPSGCSAPRNPVASSSRITWFRSKAVAVRRCSFAVANPLDSLPTRQYTCFHVLMPHSESAVARIRAFRARAGRWGVASPRWNARERNTTQRKEHLDRIGSSEPLNPARLLTRPLSSEAHPAGIRSLSQRDILALPGEECVRSGPLAIRDALCRIPQLRSNTR